MASLYSLLYTYKYAILLPLTIFEGPIVNVIAAFLASIGVMNIFAVYAIAVMGDLIGDILYYLIGRLGRHTIIPKYGRYLGITEDRIKFAEEHYKNHLLKTIAISKVAQAPILAALVLAGITKTDFLEFVAVVFLLALPKVLLFSIIGYYFGRSYVLIGQYLDNSVLAASIILVIVGIVYYIISRFRVSAEE